MIGNPETLMWRYYSCHQTNIQVPTLKNVASKFLIMRIENSFIFMEKYHLLGNVNMNWFFWNTKFDVPTIQEKMPQKKKH